MQETLTFPTLQEVLPSMFAFPELLPQYPEYHVHSPCCSDLSSSTSTRFVSAPSSPSRSKAFYFSAPTSPSWPQRHLHSEKSQGFDFPFVRVPLSSSTPSDTHTEWAHTPGDTPRAAFVKGERISCSANSSDLQAEHHGCGAWEAEHRGSSQYKADQTRSSPIFNGQQSLQTERDRSSSSSARALQSTQIRKRISSLRPPQACHAEHHSSSPFIPQTIHLTEYQRRPDACWAHHCLETEDHSSSTSSSPKPMRIHHRRSPNYSQQRSLQQDLQTGHPDSNLASLQIKRLQVTNSYRSQHPQPPITDFANRKALKKLQVEDFDRSYSRKSFYASAVPFSWEERPGTPKARSITSEVSNGHDDSPSNLLSGDLEFEFSARFSEIEDPSMSPTPIFTSALHSFRHQYADESPSPTRTHIHHSQSIVQGKAGSEEQLWPLRPPPRLEKPFLQKQLIKGEGDQLDRCYGSLASISAPHSPRSPGRFDIRGALCRISSPADAVFDPFLTAMEKSMAMNASDDKLASEETWKSPKKKVTRPLHGHLHRRKHSLSPSRVFHMDDHSPKSYSSSNGSSNLNEVKNKHPTQREINACHGAETPKGSKKWSFKAFLHRRNVCGAESRAKHINDTSVSRQSPERESYSSAGTAASGEGQMASSAVASMASTPSSIFSPSSSISSSKGKLSTNKNSEGPYVYPYSTQRVLTEESRKKTFFPYKEGLLGCLGLSSKSYRAFASLSKPLQSVS